MTSKELAIPRPFRGAHRRRTYRLHRKYDPCYRAYRLGMANGYALGFLITSAWWMLVIAWWY